MSAIGAVTSLRMPVGAVTAPAATGMGSVRQPGESSGVAGFDYTGDPLADRVIGTFARNPFGLGSLDAAMDMVSATMSFDPTRGRDQRPVLGTDLLISPGNALSALPPSAGRDMPVGELIARSQSSIARGYHGMLDGLRGGSSARSALSGFAGELTHALRRDEHGMNVYDHAQAGLEVQKQEIARKLKERVGDPRVLVAKLMSLTIAQGMIQREHDKIEELKNLIIALLMGVQIPKGLVERLQALGLGPLVERIIQDAIGSGASLSRSMQESIRALGGLGINISMLSEQNTEVGIREETFERERAAKVGSDGRLVDGHGHTLDSRAVAGDLGDLLRRRAAGIDGGDLASGVLATAGQGGIVSGSPTDGASGVA